MFIKQMSSLVFFLGRVSTYNSVYMFYMFDRNSFYTYTVLFLFCRQCCRTFPCFSWSLVDVLTRVVLIGNYKKNNSSLGITGHNFGRGPSKDWLQLAQWFLRRRFLCEFPIGSSYVKLSSAVAAILVRGLKCRT